MSQFVKKIHNHEFIHRDCKISLKFNKNKIKNGKHLVYRGEKNADMLLHFLNDQAGQICL